MRPGEGGFRLTPVQTPPNADPHVYTTALASAPWRLRDSADKKPRAAEGGGDSQGPPQRRPRQRCYLSRPSDVDASCFFVLVEHSVRETRLWQRACNSPSETDAAGRRVLCVPRSKALSRRFP